MPTLMIIFIALTQLDVWLALSLEDSKTLTSSTASEAVHSEISPSMMVTMGLELEDLQYIPSSMIIVSNISNMGTCYSDVNYM